MDIPYIEAVRALPEPIFVVAANGVVLDSNSAGRRTLGVDQIGDIELSAMLENPKEEWNTLLRHAARSRSSIPGRLILRTPQGRQAWRVNAWCARPASDSQPAVVIIRGEPDDRQAKLFLALNQQLDLLTRQGNARKLVQEELARALQARDEFVATVAHDLRNPLNVLRLTLQLLYRVAEKPGGNILGILDKLRVQFDRINSLVDRLLDVTRISAGKPQLDFSRVDLGELVEQIVNWFSQVHPYIPFQVQVENALGTWDRFRIDEAVSNLISNAIKYGLGKPVIVTVRVADDRAVVSVKDEGIGIAAADIPRIFERFERAVPLSHREGLGLGLWITKRIVEAHGGSISAVSQPGEGAIFSISLPLRSPEVEPLEAARQWRAN